MPTDHSTAIPHRTPPAALRGALLCVAACATLLGSVAAPGCSGPSGGTGVDVPVADVADTSAPRDTVIVNDDPCLSAPRLVCCGSAVCRDDGCTAPVIIESCDGGCADGACAPCAPDCDGRACGDDGCGGTCGGCTGGEVCGADGSCACGPDGGLACCDGDVCAVDTCGAPQSVVAACEWGCGDGECLPCDVPCGEQNCGDNACGSSCGACDGGAACVAGTCTCVANDHVGCCPAGDGVCSFDSCGGVGARVNDCPSGCADGVCESCTPACEGKSCGPDGCGGSCGGCTGGATCDGAACICAPADHLACCQDGAALCEVDACGVVGAVASACPGGCVGGVCDDCAPACEDKTCGPDGCGGSCGSCTQAGATCAQGQCGCTPGVGLACCGAAVCPVDSCGVKGAAVASCDHGCANGACQPCIPACDGRECGDDACGGTCGDAPCGGGAVCVDGNCDCVDNGEVSCCGAASDRPCALDSCGQVTATSAPCAYGCEDGDCLPCPTDCSASECGDDGCGGSCGGCDSGTQCVTGVCVCVPGATVACCDDARCSYDSCGGLDAVLEPCPWGCADGACLPCVPDCEGRVCGDDGCTGSCGGCPADEVCTLAGSCITCVPQCDGVTCGDNSCGGTCGACDAPLACDDGQCVALVTGRFLRERIIPNAALSQLAPPDIAPVEGVPVIVSAGTEVLATGETEADGSFAIPLAAAPAGPVTVTLAASLAGADGVPYLTIADATGVSFPTATHQVVSSPRVWAWSVDTPADGLDIGDVTVTGTDGSGALQMLGWLRDARERLLTYYGATTGIPTLGILWSPEVTPLCLSCFFPNGWGPLQVPGADGPVGFGRFIWYSGKTTASGSALSGPHQWTPSMVGHELGHYVMDVFSRSPNEGGAHSWDGLYNAGLAWSEGWANFFAQWWLSAEAEQPRFFAVQQGTQYWIDFDRIGTSPTSDDSAFGGLVFPLPKATSPLTQNMNEAVIAAMLWDMFDAGGAITESESAALGDVVLDLLRSVRMLSAALNRGYSKADLVDFLDAIRCDDALSIEVLTPTLFGFPYDDSPSCP